MGVVWVDGGRKKHGDRVKTVGKDEIDDGEVGNNEVRKKQKMSKSKKSSKSKKTVRSSDFLIPRARLAFTKLRQVFVKAPILYHFDPERHIHLS